MGIETVEIMLRRFNGRKEMVDDISAALRLIDHAIALGSWGGTYTLDQFEKLDAARKSLADAHASLLAKLEDFRRETET
jgi:hypothetical protein